MYLIDKYKTSYSVLNKWNVDIFFFLVLKPIPFGF